MDCAACPSQHTDCMEVGTSSKQGVLYCYCHPIALRLSRRTAAMQHCCRTALGVCVFRAVMGAWQTVPAPLCVFEGAVVGIQSVAVHAGRMASVRASSASSRRLAYTMQAACC
jgi:hypothetical protein